MAGIEDNCGRWALSNRRSGSVLSLNGSVNWGGVVESVAFESELSPNSWPLAGCVRGRGWR